MHPEPTFNCHWCGTAFARRHWCGRKPLYCTPTCRQRAYEHRRRGAHRHDFPRPAPIPDHRRPSPMPRYESGNTFTRTHALRPAGMPDARGRRPTLCGAHARTVRPAFGMPSSYPPCRTCQRLAARFPPDRAIDPPNDLARLTSMIERLRRSPLRHNPTANEIVALCFPMAPG